MAGAAGSSWIISHPICGWSHERRPLVCNRSGDRGQRFGTSPAKELFNRLPGIAPAIDRYGFEMGFLHATPSGQTSLEAALLRILDLCGEAAPTGSRWHGT